MRRSGLLTLLVLFTLATRTVGAESDHLKCYKIKDPLNLGGTIDLDTLQFGAESGCSISEAKLFCAPASNTSVSVEDHRTPITPLTVFGSPTTDDRVCYKLKCPGKPSDQVVTDQFGTRTLSKFKASLVCTPAVKGAQYCGDGVRNGGEACEGHDVGGATCADAGFTSGTVACGDDCQLDTSACSCGPGNLFPATGQATCWDTAGSLIACAGTGHDGDLQSGATLSYTDNGDGTITDTITGLMWEKLADDGGLHDKDATYPWDGAFAKIAALNDAAFAGYSDWRVPSVKELQSIVNYDNINPSVSPAFNTGCTDGCSVTACSCTVPNGYWSSTSYPYYPTLAFDVFFFGGGVVENLKTSLRWVRAVRSGS